MTRFFVPLLIAVVAVGCHTGEKEKTLQNGIWRGVLSIQGQQLPFNFEVTEDTAGGQDVYIINAGERLLLDEVTYKGDSVTIPLHIFDASLRALVGDTALSGVFIRHYDPATPIPFQASSGKPYRFPPGDPPGAAFSGKYAVDFYNAADTTHAVGLFQQYGDSVTGTFLTSTGDYRYMQGSVSGNTMRLSAFDGNHVYLLEADSTGNGEITGTFYSGLTRKVRWQGRRDPDAALPDPGSISTLKEGYDRIDFAFPGVREGDSIRLSDERFRNKVVVVQLLGTWCPNCMDETRFLEPWYRENKNRGVEIIGLAFERKPDLDYARKLVNRMIDKMDITYPIAIAGSTSKESTSAALPALTRVAAFPTTLYIGRDGRVKKIYTGFSGPGTGIYYEQFIEEFNQTINNLLAEGEIAADKQEAAEL